MKKRCFEIEDAEALRAKGWTYEEIGKHYGCSRQRVHQALNPADPICYEKINNEAIRNYMKGHKIRTVREFARVCGLNYDKIRRVYIYDQKLNAQDAVRISEVTGISIKNLI